MQSWFFGEPLENINHALKPIKNELLWRRKCREVKREKRVNYKRYLGKTGVTMMNTSDSLLQINES